MFVLFSIVRITGNDKVAIECIFTPFDTLALTLGPFHKNGEVFGRFAPPQPSQPLTLTAVDMLSVFALCLQASSKFVLL